MKIQDKYNKIGKSKSNDLDKTVILKPKDIETKPVKKKKKRWIFGGIIALFILIGAIGSLNSPKNDSTNSNSVKTTSSSQKQAAVETAPVKATLKYDGDTYDGYVKDNKKIQQGKYTWANGDVYDGQWADNKMNGKGVLKKANGDSYNGEFINNKKQGSGTYVWADGESYEGSFQNDLMNGEGIYHFKNGDIYDGEWSNNKMNGEGKYTYKNGQVQQGTWENNKLKK
ncbi:MORN repeat-containing protein [Clostridium ljungdahlii]|uniref:MORN repeat protein n=1 Tax=Clostridium ljungdahlii TaxID=1538 RepID=A0A162L4P7_9CLOT|nr:hypothetical protein [Clostridium ljungdahlii]OAA91082.1 MORN repeat protein [Clostridium ljungdahlii]